MIQLAFYANIVVGVGYIVLSLIFMDGMSWSATPRYMIVLDRFYDPMGTPFGFHAHHVVIVTGLIGIILAVLSYINKKPFGLVAPCLLYFAVALGGPILDEYRGLHLTIINKYAIGLTTVSIVAGVIAWLRARASHQL